MANMRVHTAHTHPIASNNAMPHNSIPFLNKVAKFQFQWFEYIQDNPFHLSRLLAEPNVDLEFPNVFEYEYIMA